MDKTFKLKPEELKQLEAVQTRRKATRDAFAEIGLLRLKLKRREKKVEEFDDETIEMQKQIAKDLEVKYGRGSIDMDSGTFTPFS